MAYTDDDNRNLLVERIVLDICGVLGPLEDRCVGWPVETVKPLVRRAWRTAHHSELAEPTLTSCAEGIRDGRPWAEALWPQ